MKRGDICWANIPAPVGRRPVVVITRDSAIPVLTGVVVAPITRTIRGIASEVTVGKREGLPEPSAITCDNLTTLPKALLDPDGVGKLGARKRAELDEALRFALGIVF